MFNFSFINVKGWRKNAFGKSGLRNIGVSSGLNGILPADSNLDSDINNDYLSVSAKGHMFGIAGILAGHVIAYNQMYSIFSGISTAPKKMGIYALMHKLSSGLSPRYYNVNELTVNVHSRNGIKLYFRVKTREWNKYDENFSSGKRDRRIRRTMR